MERFKGRFELENTRMGNITVETISYDTKEAAMAALESALDRILIENTRDIPELISVFEKLTYQPLAKYLHTQWKYGVGVRRLHITVLGSR